MCKECLSYSGKGKEYIAPNFGYSKMSSNFSINYGSLASTQPQRAYNSGTNYNRRYQMIRYN